MEQKQEAEQREGKRKKPGRSWTERYSGPIRYRRFTDIDAGGKPAILFKFDLPPGQTELPDAIYAILNEMKRLSRSDAHGGGQQHTGLSFDRSKKHGRVWRLPDNETGRTAADIIDAKLSELAMRISQTIKDGP